MLRLYLTYPNFNTYDHVTTNRLNDFHSGWRRYIFCGEGFYCFTNL
jgi:hypothetical protein